MIFFFLKNSIKVINKRKNWQNMHKIVDWNSVKILNLNQNNWIFTCYSELNFQFMNWNIKENDENIYSDNFYNLWIIISIEKLMKYLISVWFFLDLLFLKSKIFIEMCEIIFSYMFHINNWLWNFPLYLSLVFKKSFLYQNKEKKLSKKWHLADKCLYKKGKISAWLWRARLLIFVIQK